MFNTFLYNLALALNFRWILAKVERKRQACLQKTEKNRCQIIGLLDKQDSETRATKNTCVG